MESAGRIFSLYRGSVDQEKNLQVTLKDRNLYKLKGGYILPFWQQEGEMQGDRKSDKSFRNYLIVLSIVLTVVITVVSFIYIWCMINGQM